MNKSVMTDLKQSSCFDTVIEEEKRLKVPKHVSFQKQLEKKKVQHVN